MPMVFIFNKNTCYSRLAGCLACVLGGLHHLVVRQGVVVRVLRRAGAEQEGDEEEGHFSRLHTCHLDRFELPACLGWIEPNYKL